MTYFLLYLALGFILTYFSIYVAKKDEKQEAKRQEIIAVIEQTGTMTNIVAMFVIALLAPFLFSLKLILPKKRSP